MKVAYVFTEVPQIAGMFPNAELDEMAARALPIEIFILRNRPARTYEAKRIEEKFPVHRSPYLLSMRLIGDLLAAIVHHPFLFARTFARTVRDAAGSPTILVRSVGILPESIHFAAVARRRGITQIHAYWASLPALGASVISRFSGLPYTTWAHAGGDIYNRRRQTKAALRSRLREARLVFTCNRANLPYFEDLAGPGVNAKAHLLTHGVDLERFHGSGRSEEATRKPCLLAVSRLSVAKGYDILLRTCRILVDRGRTFECWIGGTGKLETALHEQARGLGLMGAVRFLGHVEHGDLPGLYREAELFVMPSVIGPKGARDGLPNVLLEAMATGVACIGSRVASIPEVIQDGETGLLVEPGDPAALAEAIERLLDDAILRNRLGRAGAARIRACYGRKEAMDRLHELLLSVRDGSESSRMGRSA